MDINFDLKKITNKVLEKNYIPRFIIFVFSTFLLALNYNLFLVSNNLVIGGTSGIAIILKNLFNLSPSIFLYLSSLVLIILSFIFLGVNDTKKNIIGSIIYPFFVSITSPLANIISPYIELDSMILLVLVAGSLCGIANGLIYKAGFTTGGADILMKILNKYGKIPEGEAVFFVNIVIMLFAAIIFGPSKFIYSLIILYLNTQIIDRILIGISNSKLFFIYTEKTEEIKDYILKDLKTGVTVLKATGGYSNRENNVLMCVVPTREYYLFKETVLEIDEDAFFVINDCYEVSGGVKGKNLPFI
jgi:uncharacterized membrane-anchored protein YitT (DUF2179 family)